MDIEVLYRYLLLDNTRSMSSAAEDTYMSRQAFIDSMSRLERELGIKLFKRKKRGIELTSAGEELQRFLKSWLPAWEQELRTLSNIEKHEQTTIHFGLSFSNLGSMFIDRMIRYETIHENVTVEFQDYTPQEAFSLLDHHALDVVCVLDSGEHPGCVRKLLPESGTQPMLMMHRSHPLAQKAEISPSDLQGVYMILVNKNMKPDPMLDSYATPFGAIPLYVPIRNETYALNVMKERNAVGLSSARSPNRFEEEGFVKRSLVDYPKKITCYVYYKKTAREEVKEFVDYFVNSKE